MLFTILQEQHDKQIATLRAANKANMDAMMERMNVLVAGKGGNKENITPDDTNKSKKSKRDKHLCIHCKAQVLHKPDNCPELKANKDKHWKGWKSVNDKA
jgi:hypothetical protein